MSDLIDREESDGNVPELTVSELSAAVKRTVEDRFGRVRVRAEIGRVSRPASGHVYLSLKDERAVIDGVMWKGTAQRLTVQPEDGLEVVVTGKLTTYPGQSKYQIVIEKMEPAGEGALMAMLEARRKALAAEGLFDEARKRAIPMLPQVIGVITSPSGAVIRDILHRLSERFPRQVLVWPVPVQGEKSAPQVAAAIRGFNALEPGGTIPRPDVLIVARGGGSLEDLWGFNEESVVRAVADGTIPLISAVGHETDVTLIDHAADLRAPTPTAAAEKAVPVRTELLAAVGGLAARRLRAMDRGLRDLRERLDRTARLLPRPEAIIADQRQRLDLAAERLPRALVVGIDRRKASLAESRAALRPTALQARMRDAGLAVMAQSKRLHAAAPRLIVRKSDALKTQTRTLDALSYLRVLDRGFAVVRDSDDRILSRADMVAPGEALSLEFTGRKTVPAVAGEARRAPPKRKEPKRPPASGSQADLFE